MADKLLSEPAWRTFAKKRELDDDALVKALARLDKAGDDDHEERLAALVEVEVQLGKLIAVQAKAKAVKGDKEAEKAAKALKDKLQELLEAVQTSRDETLDAEAAAVAEAQSRRPPLLTGKMVPLMRELKRGKARMHVLICTAGRATAVLVMRRAIAPARRKLLVRALGATGGVKFFVGECQFEDNALSVFAPGAAGGLAKRIKQALLVQTEMRMNVRMRGADEAGA